uniref:Alpha 2-HS glycoprotein n=1 Tax=Apteryx owenii TaxID=8824 RepID=A0A8B9QGF9_APTOW
MKVLVALILLVHLPIHKAVPAAPPPPLGCDDPESEAAAELAVNYINDHSHHGYKFALNRIENVRVLPQVSEELILFLELDLLETKCHILSPTPLENCTVRSFTEHVSFSMLVLEVLTAVTAALNDHNSKTTDAYLKLLEIGRAKIQVIARIRAILPCKQNISSMVIGQCTEHTQTVFLFQPGVTYSQPGQDTSAGLLPNVAQGFTNHNLRLSHNNPFASESSSSEFPTFAVAAKSVVKRTVAEAAQHDKVTRPVGFVPPPPPCPGRIHHFKI